MARDVARDLPVILKTLLPQSGDDGSAARMFAEEGELGRRLSHRNIVRVLDVYEDNGEPTIAMEYIDGETLSALLRMSRETSQHRVLPFVEAIAQAARGLHAAHRACDEQGRLLGVIHRDISPQNIMVGRDGVVKVVDFGIAKVLGSGSRTATGVLKGKIAYMAPETILGQPVDARSDLYALGLVLWEVALARKPFEGKSDLQLLTNIEARTVPPPTTLVPDFDRALEAIILKAVSLAPAMRFQSAEALAEALETFLAAQPGAERLFIPDYVKLLFSAHHARQTTSSRPEPGATAVLPPTPVSSRRTRPGGLRITQLAQTAGFRVGQSGPLVLMVFDGKTTLHQMDLLEQALTTVIAQHPRYSTLAVLSAPILEKLPDGLNERAQAIENRFEPHIVSKAMVVTPKGLAAVLIRSFLAVQSLMARNIPTRVFRSVDESTSWLQGLPAQLPSIKSMVGLSEAMTEFAAVPTVSPPPPAERK